MRIYTKQGDHGKTALFGGIQVAKDDLRISSYGTLDELNAFLGLAICIGREELADNEVTQPERGSLLISRLGRLQNELFQLGAELATPKGKETKSMLLGAEEIAALEAEIDEMEAQLEPLKSFVLPGGTHWSAHLHQARTVARRAEREIATLHRAEVLRAEVLQYINRLSDFLFVCARTANSILGAEDVPWVAPRREKSATTTV